jgi:hypothetical protein
LHRLSTLSDGVWQVAWASNLNHLSIYNLILLSWVRHFARSLALDHLSRHLRHLVILNWINRLIKLALSYATCWFNAVCILHFDNLVSKIIINIGGWIKVFWHLLLWKVHFHQFSVAQIITNDISEYLLFLPAKSRWLRATSVHVDWLIHSIFNL